MGTPLALPLIDIRPRYRVSGKMYPMTCRPVTWRTDKATKNGGLGKNHPLKGKCSEFLY